MAKSNVCITEFAELRLSDKLKSWISHINAFLINNNCNVEASITCRGANGRFAYTSRKSKKSVCIIYITSDSCEIAINGNHFIHPNQTCENNILLELPETILNKVMKGIGCDLPVGYTIPKCLIHDYAINTEFNCSYGVADVFSYNGVKSFRCRHNPRVKFDLLNDATNLSLLEKWIGYEIVWKSV